MSKLILSLLFSVFCLSAYGKTVIHAGFIFNTDNGTIEPEMSILVEGDRISEVIF